MKIAAEVIIVFPGELTMMKAINDTQIIIGWFFYQLEWIMFLVTAILAFRNPLIRKLENVYGHIPPSLPVYFESKS